MTIWVSGEDLWNWRQRAGQAIEHHTFDPQIQNERWRELDWLLLAVANLDRLALRLESFRQRPQVELSRSLDDLSSLWQQHLQQQVPLQYLLGIAHWRDFTVQVGPGVLIPRPETELLIDLAQTAVKRLRVHNPADLQWADLGTGSGAIALGLARSFSRATIHAVDCSAIALEIAQRNAERLNFVNQIRFYQGFWLEPLNSLRHQLDGIVSNPPYIPRAVVPTLQPEVANHEPHLALDGGEDGLDALCIIIQQAP